MNDRRKPVIASPRGDLNNPIKENNAPKNQIIKSTAGTQLNTIANTANTKPIVPKGLDLFFSTFTIIVC